MENLNNTDKKYWLMRIGMDDLEIDERTKAIIESAIARKVTAISISDRLIVMSSISGIEPIINKKVDIYFPIDQGEKKDDFKPNSELFKSIKQKFEDQLRNKNV